MMTALYFITFCTLYLFSKILYRNKMNPIVIYTGIWFICVFVYNCGIIRFYPLKWETFGYIYGANIVFVLGCLLGIFFSIFSVKITGNNYKRSWESKQNILRAIILLTSIISAFSIVPDVVNSISIYGFNLLANTSDMYFNEITTSQESALSFSAFIFVTAIYVGIYIVEYGFDKSIYFPFLMFVLFAFSKGSRGTFVIIIFLLLSQITLPGKQRIVSKDSFKKNIKGVSRVLCKSIQ